jgi:hypothetical protein
MRLLYGQYFDARYFAVATEIPEKSVVVDVCAGDCYLYLKYLRQTSVKYLGLDSSHQLVQWAQKHGVVAREFNLWEDEIPTSEIVVMQASFYQFTPHETFIMHKLLSAARQKVIVSEPIVNLSSSKHRWLAMLSHHLTIPPYAKKSYSGQRFDHKSLTEFFKSFEAYERSYIIPGEREMVGIFRGWCRN